MSDSSLNLFQQLRALDAVADRQLRFAAHQPYHFAAKQLFAPIVLGEVGMVAREYVIVFSDQTGSLPLALLGRRPGHNAYVRSSGQWMARYVPAHFRRYPFMMAEVPGQPAGDGSSTVQHILFIDAQAPHLGEQGERLLSDSGEPTPTLRNIQNVLVQMEHDSRRTLAVMAQLEELQLLVPERIVLHPKQGQPLGLQGVRVVDFKRLQTLAPEQLQALHQSGALDLIQAHHLSLTNLRDGLLRENEEGPVSSGKTGGTGSTGSVSFDGIDWSKF